jgi:hypothetical protein
LTRRDPFALPQPCNLIYTMDVQIGGDQPHGRPRTRVSSPLLDFTRQLRCMPGSWSITLTLSILDDVMKADQFKEHAQRVQEIWRESTWRLITPLGQPAHGRNRSFGALPVPRRPVSTTGQHPPPDSPRPASQTPIKVENAQPVTGTVAKEMDEWRRIDAGTSKNVRRRGRRSSRSEKPRKKLGVLGVVGIIFGIILGIFAILFVVWAAGAGSR